MASSTYRSSRAHRTEVGRRGEEWTRHVLNGLASGDPSVETLHGLRAPGMGGRADLDHIFVRQSSDGPVVLVLDSKVWAPGVYWSLAGRVFRGWTRFRPAQHVVTRLAAEKLSQYLHALPQESKLACKTANKKDSWPASKQNRRVTMLTPLVVIWPSRPGSLSTIHLVLGDGTPWVCGHDLAAYLTRTLPPSSGEPVDPQLVAALVSLRRSA